MVVPPSLVKELSRGGDKLNLRSASLTDQHVITLAATLRHIPIYGKVNLQYNHLSNRGVDAIVSVMRSHLSMMVNGTYSSDEMAELREVNVSFNPVSPAAPCLAQLHSLSECLL
jgi:hypothetical protein